MTNKGVFENDVSSSCKLALMSWKNVFMCILLFYFAVSLIVCFTNILQTGVTELFEEGKYFVLHI